MDFLLVMVSFVLGVFVGIAFIFLFKRNKQPQTLGSFIITEDSYDSEVYFFLELSADPKELRDEKYGIFDIKYNTR